MQSNRLFEIIYILLDKKKVTASELAEHFEVSRRTICRDIDMLSSAGIPVYADKGRYGGISLLDNYVLDKSLISDSEQQEILASLKILEELKSPNAQESLRKLANLFQKSSDDWISVDFSHWGSHSEEMDTFAIIKSCILQQLIIEFDYYNSYGQCRFHQIEPYKLWFKEKSWYLKGYSLKHEDFRIYKMTRIKHLKAASQSFSKRELSSEPGNIEMKIPFETVNLKLRFSREAAYRVYDEFDMEQIQADDKGNLVVTAEYPLNDWVYGYILSFGKDVEVLEPDHVKRHILGIIKEIAGKYMDAFSDECERL